MSKFLPREEWANICLQDVIRNLLPDLPPPIEHHCAIMAVSLPPGHSGSVHENLFRGLSEQWRRGRHGWGIAGVDPSIEDSLRLYKTDVPIQIDSKRSPRYISGILKNTHSPVGIGHDRYATSGSANAASAQPMYNDPDGIWLPERRFAIVFNGNIANASSLRQFLEIRGFSFPEKELTTDTEVLLKLITWVDQKQQAGGSTSNEPANYEKVFAEVDRHIDGACSLALLNARGDLVLYRDRHGIRPLEWLQTPDGTLVAASETVALEEYMSPIHSLKPGHILWQKRATNEMHIAKIASNPEFHLCAMEAVYFQTAESRHLGLSVHEVRELLGSALAVQVQPSLGRVSEAERKYNVVVPIPMSALGYSQAFAADLGFRHLMAIVSDPLQGRAFQAATPDLRQRVLSKKYSFLQGQIKDKVIRIVDDSIVRGDTSAYINDVLKKRLGAREVHWYIGSPPVQGACYYGIAMPTLRELLYWQAAKKLPSGNVKNITGGQKTPDLEREMARKIKADSITFLDHNRFRDVLKSLVPMEERPGHCTACFVDGKYPTREGREQHAKQKALVLAS